MFSETILHPTLLPVERRQDSRYAGTNLPLEEPEEYLLWRDLHDDHFVIRLIAGAIGGNVDLNAAPETIACPLLGEPEENLLWRDLHDDHFVIRLIAGAIGGDVDLNAAPETIAWPPSPTLGIEAEIGMFSMGLEGQSPDADVVRDARKVSQAAIAHTREPEITVDVDGALSFDLRLRDGKLVLAEISMSGRIDVSVYNVDDKLQEHYPEATPDELITVIGR